MIKAIFFDIDGTLVDFGKDEISKGTLETLFKLREKGIRLFVATGRSPLFFKMNRPKLYFDFDGYIMMNGQYCLVDQKLIYDLAIPRESLQTLVQGFRETGMNGDFLEADCLHCSGGEEELRLRKNWMGEAYPLTLHDDMEELLSRKIYQVGIRAPVSEEPDFLSRVPGCRIVRWNSRFADIIPRDGGKANGMRQMCRYFGLGRQECMAFGDGGNDLCMLEYAQIGVAMGNAPKEVKAAADYVTGSVGDEGVRAACTHFGLI